jgi:catechol 2,3-dioxygenase-like lactoylglutathione lyase family enzyme
MTTEGLRVQRVQHLSLPFPGTPESLDEARHLHGEILGLDELRRPPTLSGVGLWFAIGDQELHLFSEPAGLAVNAYSHRHPCFQVDDVDALRAHLTAEGVTTRDHDGDIPGRPRFFALDPFDNTLEFVQFGADHW